MILEKEKDCDAYHLPFPVWSSGISLLFLLTFSDTLNVEAGKPVHESVTILEKAKHRESHTTHYYVTVVWRDERQKMTVSKSLYESVSQGDSVRVCLRKSIFGVEYWQVHN